MTEIVKPKFETHWTPEQLSAGVAAWHEAAEALQAAKERELELRLAIAANAGFDQTKPEGSQKIPLGFGYFVEASFKVNRSFKGDDELNAALEKLEQADTALPDRLIRYKPELALREYKALAPELRAVIDAALKTSPGTPSIKLISPKDAE